MLTGEIRSQVDRIWDAFWSGGISNPLEVMEQITYLLFLRRLDEMHTLAENKANRTQRLIENPVFPAGCDAKGRPYEELRWSRFKHMEARKMFDVVGEQVFPFCERSFLTAMAMAQPMPITCGMLALRCRLRHC
jgi:type I restriction enzyme M protein